MPRRRVHRDAIIKVLQDADDWVRGTELVDSLPQINPSSIRLTARHLVDEGHLEMKRSAGVNGKGHAVSYRIKEAN